MVRRFKELGVSTCSGRCGEERKESWGYWVAAGSPALDLRHMESEVKSRFGGIGQPTGDLLAVRYLGNIWVETPPPHL